MYFVQLTSKSTKQYKKLEGRIRLHYSIFFDQLRVNPFIGKLDDVTYHAHVKYHWVTVWTVDKKMGTVSITYIGSRESAPY